MLFKYTDPSAEKNPLLFQSRTLSGLSFLYSMQFWMSWMIFCMGIEGRLKERFKISVIGVRGNLNGQFVALQRRWLDTVPLKCLWLTPYIPQSGSDHSISPSAFISPNEGGKKNNMTRDPASKFTYFPAIQYIKSIISNLKELQTQIKSIIKRIHLN